MYISILGLYRAIYLEKATGDYQTLYYTLMAVFLRCSSIAGKYATFPQILIKLLGSCYFQGNELDKEMMLRGWAAQTEELVNEEI